MADNINPAERFILDTLRQTSLRKMRDDDWAGLEMRVSQVGIARLDGWYGDQVRKAIRQIVEKHPGQHDQSVHGGKKGGGAKAPASDAKPTASAGGGAGAVSAKGKAHLDNADALIDKHEKAINGSNLPKAAKREALQHLSEARSISGKMREAKSKDELDDLIGRATDAGENYKGTVRQISDDRRAAHYRASKFPKPYNPRELLGGLDEADVQDIFDTFPQD